MVKKYYILMVCLVLALDACKEPTNYTIISGVNIFDGQNFHENAHLVFQDSLIIAISSGDIDYEGTVIDGRGKTIVPPLLNAHVHAWAARDLKDALHAGVFALLDMHSTTGSARRLRSFRDSTGYALLLFLRAGCHGS